MRVGVERVQPVPDALPAELGRGGGDQGGLAVAGGRAHEQQPRLRRRGDRCELVGAQARRLQARRAELRRRLGSGSRWLVKRLLPWIRPSAEPGTLARSVAARVRLAGRCFSTSKDRYAAEARTHESTPWMIDARGLVVAYRGSRRWFSETQDGARAGQSPRAERQRASRIAAGAGLLAFGATASMSRGALGGGGRSVCDVVSPARPTAAVRWRRASALALASGVAGIACIAISILASYAGRLAGSALAAP